MSRSSWLCYEMTGTDRGFPVSQHTIVCIAVAAAVVLSIVLLLELLLIKM